jgi:hypothetical protein
MCCCIGLAGAAAGGDCWCAVCLLLLPGWDEWEAFELISCNEDKAVRDTKKNEN